MPPTPDCSSSARKPGFLLAGILSLLAPGLLAGCGSSTVAKDPYGLWTGTLVTDEGVCPTETPSLLKIRGHSIVFTAGSSSQVLRGVLEKDEMKKREPRFHAELVDKDGNSNGHDVYRLVFEGYPVGKDIGGAFSSPRCRAHVTLVRQETGFF